jgi:hypothetical protein
MVPWPDGRFTLIAKLVLSLDANGVFVPTTGLNPPLQLDVADDAAELLYPSDFAPYKPACDVLVVGAAVRHRGPGVLTVGATRTRVDAHESLGPRQGFCPRGDPLDPSVMSLWATGAVSASRFQAAPPHRRVVWPSSGLRLGYERNAVRMTGDFVGPFPRAVVVALDSLRTLAEVPLAIDTICLAPEHGRITVLYRGVFEREYPADVEELLLLDFEPTRGARLDPVAQSPTFVLAEPRAVGLAVAGPARRGATVVDTGTATTDCIRAPSSRAPALPFRPASSHAPISSRPALSSADLESMRSQPAVEHDWGASSTRLLSAAALAPPGHEGSASNDIDRARAIMREIWKGQRPALEVLQAHGVTDAEWRALRDKLGRA